jgi:nitrite reductase/ring-hydroxylating ferredoxin subunit
MKKLIFCLFAIFCLINPSCSKDDIDRIPDVPVNFSASLSFQLSKLNQIGGVEVVNNANIGVAGLVLYNNGNGILAYDRCSTVNPIQRNPVFQINQTHLVEDKVSGAYFNLSDGSASKAPATRPLKQYSVSINGDLLTVIN